MLPYKDTINLCYIDKSISSLCSSREFWNRKSLFKYGFDLSTIGVGSKAFEMIDLGFIIPPNQLHNVAEIQIIKDNIDYWAQVLHRRYPYINDPLECIHLMNKLSTSSLQSYVLLSDIADNPPTLDSISILPTTDDYLLYKQVILKYGSLCWFKRDKTPMQFNLSYDLKRMLMQNTDMGVTKRLLVSLVQHSRFNDAMEVLTKFPIYLKDIKAMLYILSTHANKNYEFLSRVRLLPNTNYTLNQAQLDYEFIRNFGDDIFQKI